jgi:hypothetical protein
VQNFLKALPKVLPPASIKSLSHHLDDNDIVLVLGSSMRPTPFAGARV